MMSETMSNSSKTCPHATCDKCKMCVDPKFTGEHIICGGTGTQPTKSPGFYTPMDIAPSEYGEPKGHKRGCAALIKEGVPCTCWRTPQSAVIIELTWIKNMAEERIKELQEAERNERQ